MNSNSKWMSATVAFVVASLMIAGLATAAFAGSEEEVRKSGSALQRMCLRRRYRAGRRS